MAESTHLLPWIERVNEGVRVTNAQFPFLAYGTDWLALLTLVIATAFIGPYIDPVRNKWIITFGLIGCAGVIPLALIAGHCARNTLCLGVSLIAALGSSAVYHYYYASGQSPLSSKKMADKICVTDSQLLFLQARNSKWGEDSLPRFGSHKS